MEQVISRSRAGIANSRIICNTYLLLTLTLLTSTMTAAIAMNIGAKPVNWLLMLAIFIGMPFIINRFRNSLWGLVLTFVFTGFMGYVLGPILNLYLSLSNGPQIVMQTFATTAAIFIGLSAYTFATKKDFSYMRGFLFTGLIILLLAIIANIFLAIPLLSLTISSVAVVIMSGLILYDTSRMINGGEDNYIMMTVSLYANIYVLFVHLLNIFSALHSSE
ncbi:MAG: Bax inhibitor-1/YccA family protein [Chromatiales bacterium]|nr:Bax inhibitor-1/YccA family protein [Chromatiales bacterium]